MGRMLILDCPFCKDEPSFTAILSDCICGGTQLVNATLSPLTEEEIEKRAFGEGKMNRDRGRMVLRHNTRDQFSG